MRFKEVMNTDLIDGEAERTFDWRGAWKDIEEMQAVCEIIAGDARARGHEVLARALDVVYNRLNDSVEHVRRLEHDPAANEDRGYYPEDAEEEEEEGES